MARKRFFGIMLQERNGRGYDTPRKAIMAGKSDRTTVSEALRRAIRACPGSLNEKARRSGVDVGLLSRFLNGKMLTTWTVYRLAAWLGLELLATRKPPTLPPMKRGRPRKESR